MLGRCTQVSSWSSGVNKSSQLVSSSYNEEPYLKKWGVEWQRKASDIDSWPLLTHTHVLAYTHIQHAEKKDRKYKRKKEKKSRAVYQRLSQNGVAAVGIFPGSTSFCQSKPVPSLWPENSNSIICPRRITTFAQKTMCIGKLKQFIQNNQNAHQQVTDKQIMTYLCKGISFPIKTDRLPRHSSIYESQNSYSACKIYIVKDVFMLSISKRGKITHSETN